MITPRLLSPRKSTLRTGCRRLRLLLTVAGAAGVGGDVGLHIRLITGMCDHDRK